MDVKGFPNVSRPDPCSVDFGRETLPNSDLNFAVDFCVDFCACFFQGKRPEKNPQKNLPQNSPRTWSAANGGLRDGGLSKSEDI